MNLIRPSRFVTHDIPIPGNQLSRGLVFFGYPDNQFGGLRNRVLGRLPNATAHINTVAGTPSLNTRKNGRFINTDISNNIYSSTVPFFGGKTQFSVLWAGELRTLQSTYGVSDFLLGQYQSTFGSYDWGLYVAQSTNRMNFFMISGSAIEDPTALAVGIFYVYVGTYDSGVRGAIYRNGLLAASRTDVSGASGNSYTFRIGDDWNAQGVDSATRCFAIWDRVLTPAEVYQISQNIMAPLTAIRPINRLLSVDSVAAGAVSGTSAISLSKTLISANGVMQPAGQAALTLANATLSANGIETLSGTAALALANAVLDATGVHADGATGTSALALKAVSLAASGSQSAAGEAAIALVKSIIAANGIMQPSGQAPIVLPNAIISASGTHSQAVTGTAALQLAIVQLSAAEIILDTFSCSVLPGLISTIIRELVCDVVHEVTGGSGVGGAAEAVLTGFSFTGAADWWAGTKAGTHHEVWAGNTSRDTLTLGYAPRMPASTGTLSAAGGLSGAVFYNGCAYVGIGVPKTGAEMILGVAKFTYATGLWERHLFETVAEKDDHNKVNVHICSDGKIVAMVGRHTIYGQNLTWWKSTNAGDISTWSVKRQKALTLGQPNYPTICRLSGDSNNTYVIMRDAKYVGGGDGGLWYVYSTDEFDTTTNCTTGTKIIASPTGGGAGDSGLYFHASTNENDRIDLAFFHFVDNTTDPGVENDVVHCYLTASAGVVNVHASDGTDLGTGVVAYTSFTKANKSLIYDTSADTGNYPIQVIDCCTYDGSPAVIASRFTDGATNTEYDYLRWDWNGTTWSAEKVIWNAPGDGVNGPIGSGAYSTYSAGARCDPSNSNLMWICVGNRTGTSRLKKLVSNDLFVANKTVTEPFTQGRKHNIRPMIPFNLAGEHIGKVDVLWTTGRFTTALSYECFLVGQDWNGAVHAFDFNESSGVAANKLPTTDTYGAPANVGGPTYNQTGIGNGKAISFDGINDAFDMGRGAPLADASIAAILHWQKLDNLSATMVFGASGRKFWGILDTNEWILGVGASSAGSALGATGITAGAWHHWGVLVDASGGNPRFNIHLDGVSKFSHSDAYTELGYSFYIGANNTGAGGASWVAGDTCQYIEDWATGRDTAWIDSIFDMATGGTFTSAKKIASVTNGPLTGPVVTPTATLPTGASYTITLYSTSSPSGQTKTGTASTPITFDGISIDDGDEVWFSITITNTDKTVAPTFTEFAIAA